MVTFLAYYDDIKKGAQDLRCDTIGRYVELTICVEEESTWEDTAEKYELPNDIAKQERLTQEQPTGKDASAVTPEPVPLLLPVSQDRQPSRPIKNAVECSVGARETAKAISVATPRNEALTEVVNAQIKAGCLAEARETAKAISWTILREKVLTAVVNAPIKAGCFSEARETVKAISWVPSRNEALTEVGNAELKTQSRPIEKVAECSAGAPDFDG